MPAQRGARYGVYPVCGNSRIGRWLQQVDPLADKYPGWSPYNYTLDNPINNFDPNGLYTRNNNNSSGTWVYRQWTIVGAMQQLQLESWPIVGGLYYLQRVAINDPSFRQNRDENLQAGLENIATALVKSSALDIALTSSGIAMGGINNSQFSDLLADEISFDKALKTEVNGFKLAVPVEIDENGNPIWSSYGDRRMIMMNPLLKEKMLKEGMSTKEVNNYFDNQINNFKSDFFLQYYDNSDDYDASKR